MVMTLSEVTRAVAIDKHNLDEAAIRQPQLMWDATQALAAANKKLAQLERDKVNLTAKLDGIIRAEPSDKRVTDTAVASRVRDYAEMRELNEEIIEARYEAELWVGAVRSLGDRMRSLQEAGDLYRANYFTRESTSGREAVTALKDDRANQARSANAQRRRSLR